MLWTSWDQSHQFCRLYFSLLKQSTMWLENTLGVSSFQYSRSTTLSILTSILCVKHAHGTFLRLLKMTSKRVYWRLLLCSKAKERYGKSFWDNQLLSRFLCACTLPDLRLTGWWIYSHSFLPCLSLLGNFTKVHRLSDWIQCPSIVEIDWDILGLCWWSAALWMLPHGFL